MEDPVNEIDPMNPDIQYDEEGNPIPMGPKSNISEDVMQDMINIWSVFDPNDEDKVPIYEMETILKALDIKTDDEDEMDEVRKKIDPEN